MLRVPDEHRGEEEERDPEREVWLLSAEPGAVGRGEEVGEERRAEEHHVVLREESQASGDAGRVPCPGPLLETEAHEVHRRHPEEDEWRVRGGDDRSHGEERDAGECERRRPGEPRPPGEDEEGEPLEDEGGEEREDDRREVHGEGISPEDRGGPGHEVGDQRGMVVVAPSEAPRLLPVVGLVDVEPDASGEGSSDEGHGHEGRQHPVAPEPGEGINGRRSARRTDFGRRTHHSPLAGNHRSGFVLHRSKRGAGCPSPSPLEDCDLVSHRSRPRRPRVAEP